MTHHKKYTAGFTLVELAIVMIVIGLIVSGVLVGQDLIQQARLRKVMNQLEQFDRATATFRLKYDALPGDFAQAYRFFGSFSSCTDAVSDWGNEVLGCNGNGSDYLDNIPEFLLFWAHLSLAGMVSGSYTGFPTFAEDSSSSIQMDALYLGGINVPWVGPHKGVAVAGNNESGKLGYVLGAVVVEELLPSGPAFTTREAITIDSKMDDGKPGTGIVVAPFAEADCIDDDEYDLSKTGVGCVLGINTGLLQVLN
jgi:prepilin-type N-terminal cleavage/methylation domain-containing protein